MFRSGLPVSHERGPTRRNAASLSAAYYHVSGGERQPLRCDITHSRHNRFGRCLRRGTDMQRQGGIAGGRLSDLHRQRALRQQAVRYARLHPERPLQGKLGAAIAVITSLIVGFLTMPNNILYFIDSRHGTRGYGGGAAGAGGAGRVRVQRTFTPGIALITLGCLAMVVSIVLSFFAATSKRQDGRLRRRGASKSTRTVFACLIVMSVELFMSSVASIGGHLEVHDTVGHCQHGKPCAIACPSDKRRRRLAVARSGSEDELWWGEEWKGVQIKVHGDPVVVGQRTEIQCEGRVGPVRRSVLADEPVSRGGACKNDLGEEAGRLFGETTLTRPWWKSALGDPLSKTLVLDPVVESDLKGAFFCKLESTRRNDVVSVFLEARRDGTEGTTNNGHRESEPRAATRGPR
ncbi:hypothetical protein Q5P01_025943 [Channa striata]|uniref:Uncharacterized protein n=1 Tax=Channa striata TaxID=64152 RepID=A0AA88LFP6_CHASR|nr:hypothetical protein Q5P01_025943 [Channa striata]